MQREKSGMRGEGMTREEKSLGVSSQQHVKLLSRLICTHKRARKQLSTVTHLHYVISVDMH